MSDVIESDVTIKGAGDATIGVNRHCTWYTTNGSTLTITVKNPGDNTLTFSVSGAPEDIEATGPDGSKKFNGTWTVPPKQPAAQVLAFGNFKGNVVSIMNVSSPATPCAIVTKF